MHPAGEGASAAEFKDGFKPLHIIENRYSESLMTRLQPDASDVRRQLERILASAGFARNERLSRFLRFVVERNLDGCGDDLKETVIAVEVLGRPPDYNPKQDAIVRTEAGRLRSRLAEYYLGAGKEDPLVIELPKGGYVPSYRLVAASRNAEPLLLQPRRIWLAAGVAALAFLLIALTWVGHNRRVAPITIAILPFENLSHDPAYDYLADGLTDELIRDLSTFEGLAPRSRTATIGFKGKSLSARNAGKQLAAEYILEGSVLRAGRQLRVNVQLVHATDEVLAWSGNFDRDASATLDILDEISRAIVNNLRVKLSRGRRRYETSPEAYDLYLRARGASFRESVGPFRKAIEKDPTFAPAYAGLAGAYAYRTSTVYFDRKDELIQMRSAAEKAIELDPLLAEAHDALAMAYARDALWPLAEKSFRRAAEVEPNRSSTYTDFATCLLLPLGRLEEALDWLRIAQRSEPLPPRARLQLTWVLFASHLYSEALEECTSLPDPSDSECLGRVQLGQGKIREAVQTFAAVVGRGVKPGAAIRGYLAYGYGRLGRRQDAERIAREDRSNPFHQVLAYVGLGDKDRAFEALGRMAPQGPVRVGIALACPELEILRGDPRARALRKEVGLPE